MSALTRTVEPVADDDEHDHDHDDEHGHDDEHDIGFLTHEACVTDQERPIFDEDWQRRAFGVAVALSEFGHYPWDAFQQRLIVEIGAWESTNTGNDRWEYYEHWLAALERVVIDAGLVSMAELADLGEPGEPGEPGELADADADGDPPPAPLHDTSGRIT